MLVIERETPDQPEVRNLLEQADARSASLYPTESRFGSTLADLLSQDVRFFVARSASKAIGCGGYVLGPPRFAELKRVFVIPEARGQSVGQKIIHKLEQAARAEELEGLLLETGVRSMEAINLYRRMGYNARGPFGTYGLDPFSVFMEKSFTINNPSGP